MKAFSFAFCYANILVISRIHFDTTTLLILTLVGLAIGLVILYYIIRHAVNDALTERSKELVSRLEETKNKELGEIEKQNKLLALLVANGSSDKKFALINKDGKVLMVKASELTKHPLQDYEITQVN